MSVQILSYNTAHSETQSNSGVIKRFHYAAKGKPFTLKMKIPDEFPAFAFAQNKTFACLVLENTNKVVEKSGEIQPLIFDENTDDGKTCTFTFRIGVLSGHHGKSMFQIYIQVYSMDSLSYIEAITEPFNVVSKPSQIELKKGSKSEKDLSKKRSRNDSGEVVDMLNDIQSSLKQNTQMIVALLKKNFDKHEDNDLEFNKVAGGEAFLGTNILNSTDPHVISQNGKIHENINKHSYNSFSLNSNVHNDLTTGDNTIQGNNLKYNNISGTDGSNGISQVNAQINSSYIKQNEENMTFEMIFEQQLLRLIEAFNKMDKNGREAKIRKMIDDNPLIFQGLNEVVDNLTSEQHHDQTCPYKFKWEVGAPTNYIYRESINYGNNAIPQMNNEFSQMDNMNFDINNFGPIEGDPDF